MCVHEAAMMCGCRLPIIQEFKDILNYIDIGPSQVIPNSLGNLICFAMICRKKGVDINFENFRQLFPVAFSHGNPLFYTFVTRQAYTFIEDLISSLGCKWWEHYIFIRMALRPGQYEDDREQWGLPTKFLRECIPDWCPLNKNVAP